MSVESVENTVKIWLENTAVLGSDAIRPRPNCETTYVEMATKNIMNEVKQLIEQSKTK